MPIYEYECSVCGLKREFLLRTSEVGTTPVCAGVWQKVGDEVYTKPIDLFSSEVLVAHPLVDMKRVDSRNEREDT